MVFVMCLFSHRVIAAYGFFHGFFYHLEHFVWFTTEISIAFPVGLFTQLATAGYGFSYGFLNHL